MEEVKPQEKTQEIPQILIASRVKELLHAMDLNASGDYIDALNTYLIEKIQKSGGRCKGNGRKTTRPYDL